MHVINVRFIKSPRKALIPVMAHLLVAPKKSLEINSFKTKNVVDLPKKTKNLTLQTIEKLMAKINDVTMLNGDL